MWQGPTIAQMTSMELYTGDYVYNQMKETHIGGRKTERLPKEEWKRIENTHEAIISKEVFDKVQEIKKLNRVKNFKCGSTKKKYYGMLEGKLFCKECGRKLFYRQDSQKTKNGISVYKKYYCSFCKVNQNSNIVKEEKLEELLLDKIKNIPVKVDTESTKISIQEKKNLSCELESIKNNLQKQYEKYKKKELSKEVYLQEKQNLLRKKQEIEQELEKESIFESTNEIPDLFDNGKITKEIVDTMVEKIVVSRYGSIEIHLRKSL